METPWCRKNQHSHNRNKGNKMESMKTDSKPKDGLTLLREPFKPNQISLLPKPYKKESPKGKCSECGGWHGLPAVHLEYVGHAALTDRLLDVDLWWNWEPLSLDVNGCPFVDKDGGMWIKLTILGVTRIGYGNSGGKTGADAAKERIGDALRNAAMRFGAALSLWHKGKLHDDPELPEPEPEPEPLKFADFLTAIDSANTVDQLKAAYGHAYKFASGNQVMIGQFTEAKDLRKNQLQEKEASNVIPE